MSRTFIPTKKGVYGSAVVENDIDARVSETHPITQKLTANTAVGETRVFVDNVPAHSVIGCWILVDAYTSGCERRKITSVDRVSGIINFSPALAYAHAIDDAALIDDTGLLNVMWWGAVANGTTDDTASLNAAWGQMADGDTMTFPRGTYAISDPLDFKEINVAVVYGNGSTISAKSGTNFTDKEMLNFSGTGPLYVYNLNLNCALTSNYPVAAMLCGRTADHSACGNRFYGCKFEGYYSVSTVYSIGSENEHYQGCFFQSQSGKPVMFQSDVNESSLDVEGQVGQNNTLHSFVNCIFADYSSGNTGVNVVEFRGYSREISFRDCYIYIGDSGSGIYLKAADGSSLGTVTLDNVRFEGINQTDDATLVYVDRAGTGYVEYIYLRHITDTFTTNGYIVVSNGPLSHLYMDNILSNRKWVHLVATVESSYWVIQNAPAATLDLDAGSSLICSHISCINGMPFTGAGAYESVSRVDNMIFNSESYGNWITGGVRRTLSGYFNDDDATPSVKGRAVWIANYTHATNVTNLDDAIDGQLLSIYFNNANITLKHSATLKLQGGIDYNPPGGSVVTFVAVQGVAMCEISRTPGS